MLDRVDLSLKLGKAEYKARMPELESRLGELQREARDRGLPVLIVFEGWDAAGKGTLINRMLLALDPRGFTVHPTNPPTEEERLRPFLWRFWTRTPARGRIAIFDRSWYGRVLVERVDKKVKKKVWRRAYSEIIAFERQLSLDGAVIVKFFLHISPSVQKKRFRKLLKDPATAWKVTREDWRHHRQYDKYRAAADEMIEKTGTPGAPWVVVESHDHRHATVKAFQTVIRALEDALKRVRAAASAKPAPKRKKSDAVVASVLDRTDMSPRLKRSEYEKRLDALQKRIWEIEHEIYVKRIPVLILFEGWDAAGKGGAIKRLVRAMDPRGYEVIPFAAPNEVEKAHHYLWRFWCRVPKAGHIAVFDRTWYGRVLVERVEGFCRPDEWRRAYAEINETEEQIGDSGAVIVKFWLNIANEEQYRRLRARQASARKRWKITDEDWRNREKWPLYKQAVDEMLLRTDTAHAPWTVVAADCKLYARVHILQTVIEAVEARL